MRYSSLLFISISTFLFNFTYSFKFDFSQTCRGYRPGDCDPSSCGGPCESRYIRYFDRSLNGDRTVKTCQCIEEKVCSIVGMNAHSGCRPYSLLSTAGQRLVRLWSMDSRDRRNRYSNNVMHRFSDKLRHQQLINGNSRFCCRSPGPLKGRPERLRSSVQSISNLVTVAATFLLCFHFC